MNKHNFSLFVKNIFSKITKFLNYNFGFTLIELIVIMTILVILGFISYIQFNGVIKNSRDSARLANLKEIDLTLKIFRLEKGKYPKPEGGVDITYSGVTLWTQGYFGNNSFSQVGKLNKKPTDLVTNTDFAYSLSNDGKEYELGGVLEGNSIYTSIIQNTYAIGNVPGRSLVIGDYNGAILKSSTGNLIYVFAMPTIITRDISNPDITNIFEKQKLAYKGYGNLPATYSGTIFKVDGGFNFNPNMYILYIGTIEDIKNNESKRVTVLENLQKAYSGTILENESGIEDFINLDIDNNSPSKEVKELSYNLVENILDIDIPITITSGTGWLTYNFSNVLIDTDTRFITQDSDGLLWFATKQGVHKFDNGDWTTYTEADGLADKDVRCVIEDSYSLLWFATNKGVNTFDGINWDIYNKTDGLIDNDVVSILEDVNGNLWFATKKGISKYNGTTWTNYNPTTSGLVDKIVKSIAEDDSGNIWFATINGLSMFNGTSWTTYNEADGLADKSVNYAYKDNSGNMWFATINGISKYNGTTWTTYNEADGLVNKDVNFIYQDNLGNMWFGTKMGVSKFNGTTWTTYDGSDGLADNDVQVIYQDNESNIWIGTKKGVTIFY